MTTIGLVIGRSDRGGFSSLLEELRELLEMGCDVDLLAPRGERISELPGAVRFTPLEPPWRRFWASVREIRGWYQELCPPVIHVHGRAAGVAARVALWPAPVRIAYTPHGGFPPSGAERLIERIAQRALRRRTDLYLMVGAGERDAWAAEYGFGRRRVAVLPNTVDPEVVRARALEDGEMQEGRVLVPGAYHPRKRFEDVLRAVAEVPDVEVELVGNDRWDDGRHRRRLEELANELRVANRIVFSSEIGDLLPKLAAAPLVLFPSNMEGLPLAALEAQCLGAPVAWSRIPQHEEVFGDHPGRYPVGDHHALGGILAKGSWRSLSSSTDRARHLHDAALVARKEALETLLGLAMERDVGCWGRR